MSSVSTTAFTLIELLIVVAVIALLAAIAVPNFLEAQTRSKVAAAKESQRVMSVALEAYRTDNIRYPPGLSPGIHPDAIVETWRITSPVAYVSGVPMDIFYMPQFIGEPPQPMGEPGGEYGPGGRFMHYTADVIIDESWVLMSYGPDKTMQFEELNYDPTNGTTSEGDIYRVGFMP